MMISRVFIVLLLLLSIATCFGQPFVPKKYPLFKQCDPTWGDHFMGGKRPELDTICVQGCAMSSVAMALAGKGYKIPGHGAADPDTLNEWLRENGGYKTIGGNPNNLVLDAPERISPGDIKFVSEVQKPAVEELARIVERTDPIVVAHVNSNHHFVLVIGLVKPVAGNSTEFIVHDPGDGNSFFREYSEMSDILLYNMNDKS